MTGHLLHVGYPKTGSSFLRRWFAAHPQLAYLEGGIGGFSNLYEIGRQPSMPRPDVLYRVTSAEWLVTPHLNVGRDLADYRQVEPIESARDEVCATLASLFPNAQVLLVTRGFRSMCLSMYSQHMRTGGDGTLQQMIASAIKRSVWSYDDVLAMYRRAFGEEQVIVMPYELLRDDPDEFTRWLAHRLGIDHVTPTIERVNESLSSASMYWYPRLTRLVRRIPSRRVFGLYIRAAFNNRLVPMIDLLERLRPGTPVTAAAVPDEVVNAFRGKAESMRGNPLYAPYAADYLHG